MQKTFTIAYFVLFSILSAPFSYAQPDTLETNNLKEFVFFEDMKRYELLKRKTVKIYPYVIHAVTTLQDLDSALEVTSGKRAQNKLIKETNEQLKEDFRYVILNMSELEGELLVKLLHLYTGLTAYDIISQYQSEAKALLWQGASVMGGANLKYTFDAEKEKMLAHIVSRIESGNLEVLEEPILITREQHKDLKKTKKRAGKNIKKMLKDSRKAKEKEAAAKRKKEKAKQKDTKN